MSTVENRDDVIEDDVMEDVHLEVNKKTVREACKGRSVDVQATATDVIFTNVAAQFYAECESQGDEYKTELNKLMMDPSVEIEHAGDVTALHTTWSHLSELQSSLETMVGCIAAEVNSNIVSTLGENFQAELSQQEIGSVRVEIIEDITILHGPWSDLRKAENVIKKILESRPTKTARFKYDRSQLKEAYEAVMSGRIRSARRAAKVYGIPLSTLQDRVTGRVKFDSKVGQSRMLTAEEEGELAAYLISMSDKDLRRTKEQLRQMAYCVVAKDSSRSKLWIVHKMAGVDWYKAFRTRHPSVSLLKVVGPRYDNPNRVTAYIIETFYNTLGDATSRLNLTKAPRRIYSCDSTRIPLDLNVFSGNPSITMMACCNGTGHLLPPLVIFPSQKSCTPITLSAPDNWCIRFSEDGCLRADIFEEWFEFVFVPSLGPERPVLLLLDTYRSRETLRVVEIAKKEQIEILMFPLYTTKLLQPLNVCLFQSMKEHFRQETKQCARVEGKQGQKLKRTFICPILNKALQKIPACILADGFVETGISPYKRVALDELHRYANDRLSRVSFTSKNKTQRMASQQPEPPAAVTSSVEPSQPRQKLKILNYDRSQLKVAYEAVKSGKIRSVRRAARTYGLPLSTLRDRMTGKVKVGCKLGAATLLTVDEERKLVAYLQSMSDRGSQRTRQQLRQMAYCILAKDRRRYHHWVAQKDAGVDWYKRFINRHKSLPIQTARPLKFENSKHANSLIIETFYSTLAETTARLNMSNAPERIYNCDSTAIRLDLLGISDENDKSSDSSSNTVRNISMMICGNAAGHLLPPVVIFQEKNFCNAITVSAPDEWYIRFTDDGCLRADIFEEWFEFVFVPSLGPERPVLLLLDTYRSRESLRVVEIAKKEQIEILMFPLYTTKLLQPVNVSLFGLLKEELHKEANIIASTPGHQLPKMTSFCTILNEVLGKLPQSTLSDGFRDTGICPYRRTSLRDLRAAVKVTPCSTVTDQTVKLQKQEVTPQPPEPSGVHNQQNDYQKRSLTASDNRAKRLKPDKSCHLCNVDYTCDHSCSNYAESETLELQKYLPPHSDVSLDEKHLQHV